MNLSFNEKTPPTNRISEEYFCCKFMSRSTIIVTNFVYAVGMKLGSVWMQLYWIKWIESVMLNMIWINILPYAPNLLFSINSYNLYPPRRIRMFSTNVVSFNSVSVSVFFLSFFLSLFIFPLISFLSLFISVGRPSYIHFIVPGSVRSSFN